MPKTKHKIHILFSAVSDIFPKYWKEQPKWVTELTEKALNAWEERKATEKAVRFLHQLPTKYGSHFRFFVVAEHHNGSLLISRGYSDGAI